MSIKKAFDDFKNIRFPDDSAASEELGDIFCELVLYDSFVAGQVDNLIGRRDANLEYEPILENRLATFLENINTDNPDYNTGKIMLSYINEIKKLLMLAKEEY